MNENRIAPRLPEMNMGADRQKPDGIMDPAGEAGWFLMREREDRGLSLEQAGEQTGIHPYHLEAIELGNMTNMPSRAEALEMIAADALKHLHPEDVANWLMHEATFMDNAYRAKRGGNGHTETKESLRRLGDGRLRTKADLLREIANRNLNAGTRAKR